MTITKGDTHKFTVTVKDQNGTIVDLTGYTMTFYAKENINSDSYIITSNAAIPAPLTGEGNLVLLHADTDITVRDYEYAVKIDDGADNVYTVIKPKTLKITAGI